MANSLKSRGRIDFVERFILLNMDIVMEHTGVGCVFKFNFFYEAYISLNRLYGYMLCDPLSVLWRSSHIQCGSKC